MLDPWLSDGWSLIVCPGLFLRLNLHSKVDSIVCPGRFGVLSWCNDILARLGLLKWCNEVFGLLSWCNLIVSQGTLARPDLLLFDNTMHVTRVPFKIPQILLKRTRRIQSCNLLANALVCCSATQGLCFTIVLGNARCGCTSAVCIGFLSRTVRRTLRSPLRASRKNQ